MMMNVVKYFSLEQRLERKNKRYQEFRTRMNGNCGESLLTFRDKHLRPNFRRYFFEGCLDIPTFARMKMLIDKNRDGGKNLSDAMKDNAALKWLLSLPEGKCRSHFLGLYNDVSDANVELIEQGALVNTVCHAIGRFCDDTGWSIIPLEVIEIPKNSAKVDTAKYENAIYALLHAANAHDGTKSPAVKAFENEARYFVLVKASVKVPDAAMGLLEKAAEKAGCTLIAEGYSVALVTKPFSPEQPPLPQ